MGKGVLPDDVSKQLHKPKRHKLYMWLGCDFTAMDDLQRAARRVAMGLYEAWSQSCGAYCYCWWLILGEKHSIAS